MTEKFDDKAGVPYIVDDDGEMMITYENPRSLKLKCEYVNTNNLGGIMFWEYSGDSDKGELRKTLKKYLDK